MKRWIKEGFSEFRKGSFGDGGKNIYVSRGGVLQRIYNFDLTGNGYPELPIANSHRANDRGPLRVYTDFPATEEFYDLPSNGIAEGYVCDLNGDGYDDVIIACQGNGTHADNDSIIYFGSPDGLSEDYKTFLYTPCAVEATAGDYTGTGRMDVCFLCTPRTLKIFTQDNGGYNCGVFYTVELDKKIETVFTFDVNGDGCDDLYCKLEGGECVVFWGSEQGISKENLTSFFNAERSSAEGVVGTTASRSGIYNDWHTTVVTLDAEDYLFASDKENLYLFSYSDGRFEKKLVYPCDCPVYAIGTDLDGDGRDDLAVVCCRERGSEDESFILWGGDGFGKEITKFTTNNAKTLNTAVFDGKPILAVAQAGYGDNLNTPCLFMTFEGRNYTARSIVGEDCGRILFGSFNGKKTTLAMVEHEWADRVFGHEEVYLFKGSEKGYDPNDRFEVEGRSAVDTALVDFNDDGRPDVLVVNCNESQMTIDWGSFIYYMNEKGELDPSDMETIPTVRAHGCAVGDLYHTGYLDIVTGGILNREIRILKGGPDGYSKDRMERIVLGPDAENYEPVSALVYKPVSNIPPEERKILDDIGEVRWLYTADFNGDGWLDLFVSSCMHKYSFIFFGGPEGYSIDRCQKLNTEGGICANVADLNKDGYPDLVVGCHHHPSKKMPYETYLYIYWGGKDGYSEARKTALPIYCANSVSIGDFNGDGWLDIYATSYNNGRFRDLDSFVYFNDHGHFSYKNKQRVFNHSGCGSLAGDFNHDGYADLLVVSHKDEGDHRTQSYVYYGGPDGLDLDNPTSLPSFGPHGASAVDPGNVMDRGEREYYTSEKYKADGTRATIFCEKELLSTSYLEIEYRSAESEDRLELESWRTVNEGEWFDVKQVMQYRLALCAKCGCGTPRVTRVEVDFE